MKNWEHCQIVLWGNHLGPRPGLWTRRSGPRTKLSMAIFNSFCLTRIQAVQGKPETNESIRVTCFARNCLNTRLVTEGKARLKISLKQCRFDSTNNHCQIIQRRAGGVTIGFKTKQQLLSKAPHGLPSHSHLQEGHCTTRSSPATAAQPLRANCSGERGTSPSPFSQSDRHHKLELKVATRAYTTIVTIQSSTAL